MAELVALRYDNNWADEFDVEGFIIVEQEWWENHQKEVREKFGKQHREVGFGTNEEIEYCDADDYLNSFTVLSLTQDEIGVLKKALGGSFFGIVPMLEFDDDE